MNNPVNMNANPNFNQNGPSAYNPAQPITVVLVNDMSQADSYTINPNTSMLFMDYAMKNFKMRSRDMNGFPGPDRTWTMTETTPQPATNAPSNYATKEELGKLQSDMNEQFNKLFELLK